MPNTNLNTSLRVATVAALVALGVPTAGADPSATTVAAPDGTTCYVFSNDDGYEFWVESNGLSAGGVESGTPVGALLEGTAADGTPANGLLYNAGPSGLQREPTAGADGVLNTDDDVAPDTFLDLFEWTSVCT